MRLLPDPIEQAMITGNFVGDSKWDVRVTVEPDWYLHVLPASQSGTLERKWVPLRYWQREANDQVEVEVPNLASYEFDRSLEQAAASCTLTFDNVKMEPNLSGSNRRLGLKGYYAPHYGQTAEARARWAQVPHEWAGVLDGNALLRTYAGVGSEDMDVHVAVAAGNLMLDGVWLVDDWRTTSGGTLVLTCRDMMALAIDQPIYPPLTPVAAHPLEFFRWVYDRRAITAASRTLNGTQVQPGTPVAAGDKRMVFIDSAVDRWYPAAAPGSEVPAGGHVLHGHKGTDSIDGDPNTFALSVGNSHPSKSFCTDWWTYACGEHVNSIYLHPWAGNYTCYVSVMEGGQWQGAGIVPYEFYPMNGADRAVDTGANIPYVAAVGVPWETAVEIQLPRVYLAEQIRISFRDHTKSQWGPWYYRCGIREVRGRLSSAVVVGGSTQQISTTVQPLFYGADSLRDPDDLNTEGYATVSTFGQIDVFGDVIAANRVNASDRPTDSTAQVITTTKDGQGYWVLRNDGSVTAYGNAPFYGSPRGSGYMSKVPELRWTDIQPTHTGLGYWCVRYDGLILSFGDAPPYTAVTVTGTPPAGESISRISPHPSAYGLWLLESDGSVHVRGAASFLGNYTATAVSAVNDSGLNWAADIQATGTGLGYWLLAHDGTVQTRGDAVHYGHVADGGPTRDHYLRHHQLLPAPTDAGYLILRGDGKITEHGTVYNAGGPIPGTTGEIRRPGNIRDFADIIYLLATWCGFHLYNAFNADGKPSVYGNIETTGSFPKDTMPLDFFDKKVPADVMKQLAELHGYVGPYCDEQGGFRWHSPNYWNFGNFLIDGTYTTAIPELDERWNLLEASVSGTKRNDRSEIILSTEEPTEALSSTVITRFIPPNQYRLRGMSRPAVWVLPSLVSRDEQRVMAELVAMHLWFRSRTAQVTGVYHPGISINDQVRILDEATGETNIHYVLSKRGSFDRRTGVFTMSIDAHWLGDGTTWAIRLPDAAATAAAEQQFRLSALTVLTLRSRGIDLSNLEGATKLTHYGTAATAAPGAEGQATP